MKLKRSQKIIFSTFFKYCKREIRNFLKWPFSRKKFVPLYAWGVKGSFKGKVCTNGYVPQLNWNCRAYDWTLFRYFWIICRLELCRSNHHQKSVLLFCMHGETGYTFFFINNPFLTLVPKIVYVFLKNHPEKLFSNCLVDGLLTSIVEIFKDSKRPHSLLQGHLEYLMHTFELASPKVSISLRLPMHKKDFSLFSQWIV